MTNRTLTALAEARFKAKAERAADAPLARAQYEAEQLAVRQKTARLRAQRLARDAELADRPVKPNPPLRRTASFRRRRCNVASQTTA